MLDRRQILLGLTALMGGSLLPASARALEQGFAATGSSGTGILTAQQVQAVSIIADIIIPQTDTPGATGVGVPHYIDQALTNWLFEAETDDFLASLNLFLAHNPGFLRASDDTRYLVIKGLDDRLDDLPADYRFYRLLKELVLIGYYTSEVGATEELAFDPVPGGYSAIKVTEETKAWST
jgi:hypothetical protein